MESAYKACYFIFVGLKYMCTQSKVCFCFHFRWLTLPYVNIGLIKLLHLDSYFEAIGQFTNAIQVDPLDIRPYLCRAQAYHKVFP